MKRANPFLEITYICFCVRDMNSEVFHTTSAEVNTQVASYFDVVDNAVARSDTNKNILLILKLLIHNHPSIKHVIIRKIFITVS